MKPHEQFATNEIPPQTEAPAIPQFDSGANYNGMYDSAYEFKAAEKQYKLPEPTEINTINLEQQTAYPLATTEQAVATMKSEVDNLPSIEVSTNDSFEVGTIEETNEMPATEVDNNIIDVEAKEITDTGAERSIDAEDLTTLANSAGDTEIDLDGEKIKLTSKLKSVAKGVLTSMDHLFESDEVELTETVDWLPYIMSEPDYYDSYDATLLLQRLLNKEYERRQKLLRAKRSNIAMADYLGQPPPPPTTPEAPQANKPEDEQTPEMVAEEPLKIEMDSRDKPQLGYTSEPEKPGITYTVEETPALTYDNPSGQSPGQAGQKQITQQ